MRIYVLNLARSVGRRAHIERDAAGVTLDFIEAVDGQMLTDAQRGANLSLGDAAGDTADSLARQQGNAAMTTLLGELESKSK